MLAILTLERPEDALMPEQIIERLEQEFERVTVDGDKGRAKCQRELDILRTINAPAEIVAMTERAVATAQWIIVNEGALSFEFLLTRDGNIRIDHKKEHHDLIDRCARVLKAHVEGCG